VEDTERVTPVPGPDVRAELDRILASKGFASAGRLSKLLRYTVDKTLAGETDQLKEYAVGIEVFDRDDNYDPRLDSIVRVEAGRLRTKLDEYYNGDGAGSPIRISLPRGGYSAQFHRAAAPTAVAPIEARPQPNQPPGSRAAMPLGVVLLIAIAAMVFWLGRDRSQPLDQRPTAAVLPFEANMIGGDNSNYSALITEAGAAGQHQRGVVHERDAVRGQTRADERGLRRAAIQLRRRGISG
jgi:hypothetical protein